MINIIPNNDLKDHIESSICECNPVVQFENGEIIIIHNSYDGREWKENITQEQLALLEATSHDLDNTMYENTQLFISGFNKKELSLDDLKEILKEAEKEEEFEVAISVRDAIKSIEN